MSDRQFDQSRISIHSTGDNACNVAVNYGTINYVVQRIQRERFQALRQLPRDITNFVGRSEQLDEVKTVLARGNGATIAISAVSGMGGVGKSALAIRVAHLLKGQYPDAQLYVNLQGADSINCQDPFLVLGSLLIELGVDEKLVVQMDLESRSKWWRSLLSELRAIVVFDNARDAKQVWPLLPGSDGPCAVMVTSRQELSLDNVARLRLNAMKLDEALTLLSVMSERSFGAADLEVAAKIVEYCGALPLAIKIVGALLRRRSQMTLANVIEALKEERDRLTAFAKQHQILQTDEYLDVRSSLSLSLKWLTAEERSVFQKVAAIPGVDFGWQVAEFVTYLERVKESLDRLADEQLLEAKGDGRYQFHDLVRLLGREQWENEKDLLALEARVIHLYFGLTKEISSLLDGHESISIVVGVAWCKQEWQNLKAVVITAASRSIGAVTIEMPNLILKYSSGRENFSEIVPLLELSLEEAQKHNHRDGKAAALGSLGNAYFSLGQYQRAIDFYRQSIEIVRKIGDRQNEAIFLGGLGNTYQFLGQYQRAIDLHQQSIDIKREIGDRNGEADSLNGLGETYFSLDQYQCAIDLHQQCLDIKREIGDRNGEANSFNGLGLAYYSLDQYQRAIDLHQQCLDIKREIGDRNGEANSLFNMALALGKSDEYFNALQKFQQAKLIYEDLQLDHKVERCNEALLICNQIIVAEPYTPPQIAQASKESTIDWDNRQKQLNQPIVRNPESDRKMNQIFYFCVGLAICFVVWKMKN